MTSRGRQGRYPHRQPSDCVPRPRNTGATNARLAGPFSPRSTTPSRFLRGTTKGVAAGPSRCTEGVTDRPTHHVSSVFDLKRLLSVSAMNLLITTSALLGCDRLRKLSAIDPTVRRLTNGPGRHCRLTNDFAAMNLTVSLFQLRHALAPWRDSTPLDRHLGTRCTPPAPSYLYVEAMAHSPQC